MVHYDNYRVKSQDGYPFDNPQQFYPPEPTATQVSTATEPHHLIHPAHNPTHPVPSSEQYNLYADGQYHVSNPSLLMDSCYAQQPEYYADYRWNAWQVTPQPNPSNEEAPVPPQYNVTQYENGYKQVEYYADVNGQHGYQPGMLPTVEELKVERDRYHEWIGQPNAQNCKTRTKDKYRVVYTDHQRLELEKEFHYSRYITIRRKAELAVTLGLSERQVKIWFQNRRAKERKVSKKKGNSTDKGNTSVSGSAQSDHPDSPTSSPSASNPSPAPSGLPNINSSQNIGHPLEPVIPMIHKNMFASHTY